MNIRLRGFEEITKTSHKKEDLKSKDCLITTFDPNTGAVNVSKEHFVIETDGCALQHVLTVEGVDPTRTTSNNVIEIF